VPDVTIVRSKPKEPLTAAEVKAIKTPTEGRLVVRDPGCTGLALRVTSAGVRTWSLEIKAEGRQRRFTVGDAKVVGLAEARKIAGRLRDQVEAGNDPVVERRKKAVQAEEARREAKLRKALGGSGDTVRGLLDLFERLKAKAKDAPLRSWPEMRQMIEFNFADHLDRDPADVTDGDFRAVLDAAVARQSPIAGKRAVRYLGRVYNWAVKTKRVAANPAAGLDLDELARPERPRQRVLTDDEIRAVWRAAVDAGAPFGDLARLYLLTALRREEAAGMRRQDLDGDVLVLGDTKNDQPHRLPLSQAALAIVRAQPERGKDGFVFTLRNGASIAGKATNWHRENAKLVAAAGTAPWVWRDLRRTARTLLARIGADDLVAELVMNHALPGKLRRTYVVHKYQDEMREALEGLAAFVDQIIAGTPNVVSLRRAAG
jgi:integrase